MKANPILPWALSLLSFLALGYLFYQNQDMQAQLIQMQQQRPMRAQQPTAKGKDSEAPYLASQVKNSIIKSAKPIQACYLALLKTKPKITSGKLKLDWQIDSKGRVLGAGVIKNQLQNPEFAICVTQKIAAIRFPPPPYGQTKYVEHSLLFKDEGALELDRKARAQGPLVQVKK